MKRILIYINLLLATSSAALANVINPEEALQRIDPETVSSIFGINSRAYLRNDLNFELRDKNNLPTLYVFRPVSDKGFMVVSADDNITPLLAFSDNESIDPENLSPALMYWLEEYNNQIEYARTLTGGLPARGAVALPQWTAIEPMVKTKWNQTAPYNNLTPLYNNMRTYTGCVATSVAQVMKYWNYPESGVGRISYFCQSLQKNLSLNLSNMEFDWVNMLDDYSGDYTEEEATAVASLMQAVGYSVQMQYSTTMSGTPSGLIPAALVNNFNYDAGLRIENRNLYTYSTWAAMLYENLSKIGPVVYNGASISGIGHSFVCDGYSGNGYFHFNWGWSGSGDGYYLLDLLSPSSLGVGGGDGGYNFMQDVIFGIQPQTDTETPKQSQIVVYGNMDAYMEDGELVMNLTGSSLLGWSMQGVSSTTVNFGAKFIPEGNENEAFYVMSSNPYTLNLLLAPGQYLPLESYNNFNVLVSCRPSFDMEEINLKPGVRYKVVNVVTPVTEENWEEVLADVGNYNYCYVTYTDNGSGQGEYVVENNPQMKFSCDNLEVLSSLYQGVAVDVKATISNNNDTELTKGVTFILLNENGEIKYTGTTLVMTLAPGETVTKEWTTPLAGGNIYRNTDFHIGLYNPETGNILYESEETVTMQRNPGTPTFSVAINIDNAAGNENNTVLVENSADFNVTTNVECSKNIFSYPVSLWITESNNPINNAALLSYPYDIKVAEEGQTISFNSNVNFPNAEVGKVYYLVAYIDSKLYDFVAFKALNNGAGIELIENESNSISFYHDYAGRKLLIKGGDNVSVDVFNLQGQRLGGKLSDMGDVKELDLSGYGRNIIVVTAKNGSGEIKTIKLAL